MTKQPEYFVIAGPNGAGKSTHGHLFVTPGLEIFNGDLEYAKLQKKYPLVEPIRLQGGVASLLENARNEALHQKKILLLKRIIRQIWPARSLACLKMQGTIRH